MNWLRCLPLALLRMRTRPRTDLGVSPYEALFGLPYLTTIGNTGAYEEGECSTRKYVQTIANTLEDLRNRGYLPQSTPMDFKIHSFKAGDWVLIREWNEKPLTEKWEGPFQILLMTETAVRTQEKGWSHATRVKGPVPAPENWEIKDQSDTGLTLRRRKTQSRDQTGNHSAIVPH